MKTNLTFIITSAMMGLCPVAYSAAIHDNVPADSVQVLQAVEVTGSRLPVELGTSARIVTVLDSVKIASMPAHTVNDILKFVAGVDVRQRGDMGVQTDISVRGGTFDQIAVLINGINISDPQTGHNAADFPVDMADIDRIEVLEGPAARVYGTSSLVGAINIVTKSGGNGISLHAEGGSYGYFSGGAGVNIEKGRWRSRLSANVSRSDGYSRNAAGGLNSDFKMLKSYLQGSYKGDAANVSYHAGVTTKDFGSNTFYSSKFDDQFEHTLKTFLALSAETKGFLHLRPSVYWNHSEDRFELMRGAPHKIPFNRHRTDVLGLEVGAWFESVIGRTSFGAGMRNEGILSTNLGNPLANPKGEYAVGLNRTQISYWVDHNVSLKKFTLSLGVSSIRNTGSEEGFGFYPGIDMSYRIGGSWKLYASYNSSFRIPTFTDLFYSVGGHLADPNLRPERMQSLEGGVKYSAAGANAVASIYHHAGTDMIDWIKDTSEGDDAVWTSMNHTRLNTTGCELSLRLDFPALLSLEDSFVRNINLSYSHIRQDKDLEPGLESMYALEYLKEKVVAQIDFHVWKKLFLNMSYRYQWRNGYTPYSLVDARVNWNAGTWMLFLEANNILDHTYYDFGHIPQPGIWFKAGVKFEIYR